MSILFKELLIVDKLNKTARKIDFHKGINVITSTLNSVGKTSLSLMLLYGFGARVKFSDKWDLNNIFTQLTILNDSHEIILIRYKDTFKIKTKDEQYFYPLQKSGYSEKLYELLGLTIKIKDKNSDNYSTAVPSLYLLPYYLSQTNEDERSVFTDLNMYSKPDLLESLYYHVGALDNKYSSILQNYTKAKLELDRLKKEKDDQILEIKYLEEKLDKNKSLKIIDADSNLESDIMTYKKYAEKNQEYYLLIKRKADLNHKIKLLKKALSDNEVYSSNLLNEEAIICPVCKSDITGFISSALTVKMSNSDLNSEIAELKSEILLLERKITSIKPKIEELKNHLSKIEDNRENIRATRAIIVWNEELQLVKRKFADTQLKLDTYRTSIKNFSTQIKKYDENKKSADIKYRNAFSSLLDTTNVSKSGIDLNKINLYQSFSLSGSESPRIAISRFFAFLESKNKESIVMPIIFDFPNIDMIEENINKCFALIFNKISDVEKYPQSFIFSINCIERFASAGCKLIDAHILDMSALANDDDKRPQLLCKHDFIKFSNEINLMLNYL